MVNNAAWLVINNGRLGSLIYPWLIRVYALLDRLTTLISSCRWVKETTSCRKYESESLVTKSSYLSIDYSTINLRQYIYLSK